jgi:DNA-binding MurR/RpiR family transcriptional regulator
VSSAQQRNVPAAKDVEKLRADIVRRYESLSPRLKLVAQYVLDHPNDMGLETLAVIAARCHVQPSTVVRFAKAMGYDGASDMQRLFREEIVASAPSPSYAERIRQLAQRAGHVDVLSPHELMLEFADSNIIALEHLKQSVRAADLEAAVALIRKAPAVYIIGLRRSFPVASYLAYALRHVDEKRAYLIDGVAGMLVEQSGMVRKGDLLIAISFRPYARETAEVVESARARGARTIAISDSSLSPVARDADVAFEIKDAEVRQFRSLTASLCLAQTLVISYAFQAERPGRKEGP